MNRGYVKVWRKIYDSGLIQMPHTFTLFMFILMNATHKDTKVGTTTGVVELKRGQYISGRQKLARDLKQSEQQIRTSLDRLVNLEILTIKSTSKYSVYTIEKYDLYQDSNQQTTSTVTSNQPAINQQTTTKQELKNLRSKKVSSERTLKEYLDECRAEGKPAIPEDDKVFQFIEDAKIPEGFLDIAWFSFREKFIDDSDKKQKDWVQTFRNYVRSDYLKVWSVNKEGEYYLTTYGKQMSVAMENKK